MQGNYKICVYAICLNEARNIPRWISSMAEADGIYVLDTGSQDGSAELLRSLGAHVKQRRVEPWRFDTARNLSLAMVPEDADLCVCTDLDECFHPGWRAGFEAALAQGARLLRYRYTWSFSPDGREGSVFWIEKAHARHGFRWVNPVHEVLLSDTPCHSREAAGVQLDHHPDPEKSRAQYLPLLEQAVKENPDNDRNVHYLGREYLYRGRWRECEAVLRHHLTMPSARWEDERCASMRYLARALAAQSRRSEAWRWLHRAMGEAPHLREPWLDASRFCAEEKDWCGSLHYAQKALSITQRGKSYINEADSWGALPYDLAAVAAYYLGARELAVDYGQQAAELSPWCERLRSNLEFYRENA